MHDGMRILVCGSRDFPDKDMIRKVLAEYTPFDITIIEGGARGADTLAREVAEEIGFKVREFKAQWDKHRKKAGPIRNKLMLTEGKPHLVYAFYTDRETSKGTKNMVHQALAAGVEVREYELDDVEDA